MAPITTTQGYYRPLGYQQIVAGTLSTATKLTMPTTLVPGSPPTFARIQNNGTTAARWRDDGAAPTATVGMNLAAGAELDYSGDLTVIQFIYVTNGAILDIAYYG